MIAKPVQASVIIPSFNRAATICRAVDSVISQQNCECEIIVVEDGSSDGTEDLLKRYGERVTYLWQNNAGASAARNTGLRNACGKYVFFLDSDDYYYSSNSLAKLLGAADERDLDMVLGCWIGDRDLAHGKIAADHRGWNEKLGRDAILLACARSLPSQTGGIAWRRNFLNQIGGWREDLVASEDVELGLRALLRGARPGALDEVVIVWCSDSASPRMSSFPTAESYASRLAFAHDLAGLAAGNTARDILAIGHYFYRLARECFRAGFDDFGQDALRQARAMGVRGHTGSLRHRALATLLGLPLKERVATRRFRTAFAQPMHAETKSAPDDA